MSRATPRFRRVNPPLPPPGSKAVIEVIVSGSVEGQTTVNTFYYAGAPAGSLGQSDLLSAIAAWTAAFMTNYRAALSSDWKCIGVGATCLTQPTLQSVFSGTSAGLAGTGPASHEPNQCAVVISRYTNVKGQHGRGRIYLPAIPTSWVTGSVVTVGAGLTAYQNVATDLGTGITVTAIAYAASVVQRAATSPRGLVGVGSISLTAAKSTIGTIRRRRLGRGK